MMKSLTDESSAEISVADVTRNFGDSWGFMNDAGLYCSDVDTNSSSGEKYYLIFPLNYLTCALENSKSD